MLKILRKSLESEKKDSTIFDIILYGSSARGKEKARDIDLMIIFLEGSLKERLEKIQDIKSRLKDEIKNLDIKQMLLRDMFSSDFLARTGILLEGISIFREKSLSEIMGFKSYGLFWYNLKGLNHSQKVRFNYMLAGRGMKGVIEELGGERLVSGAVKIPIRNSIEFEDILKANKIDYKNKSILEQI